MLTVPLCFMTMAIVNSTTTTNKTSARFARYLKDMFNIGSLFEPK